MTITFHKIKSKNKNNNSNNIIHFYNNNNNNNHKRSRNDRVVGNKRLLSSNNKHTCKLLGVVVSLILGVSCMTILQYYRFLRLLPSLPLLSRARDRNARLRSSDNGDDIGDTFDSLYRQPVLPVTDRTEEENGQKNKRYSNTTASVTSIRSTTTTTNTPRQFHKHSIREKGGGGLDVDVVLFTAQSESDLYILGGSSSNESPFCVPWNVNSDDWWASALGVEWHVFHQDATHYCFEKFPDHNKRQFFQSLYHRQFPKNDNDNTVVAAACRTMHVKQMWSSGLGADLSNVVDGLIHGALTGRPFQLARSSRPHDFWHYACPKPCRNIETEAACPTADMFCYFLPLSNCPRIHGTARTGGVLLVKNTTTSVNDDDAVADEDNSTASSTTPIKIEIKNGYYQTTECLANDPVQIFTQTPFKWYLEFVMRPQTWLRKMVYDLVVAQSIQQPCTVMHVRRGDIVLHNHWSRRYHAIAEYLNVSSVNSSSSSSSSTFRVEDNILLLTDDHNAIGEATMLFPNKHWMYIHKTRFRADEGGWEQHLPSHNGTLEMAVLLAEIQLARSCGNSLIRSKASSGFGNFLQGAILDVNASAWIAYVEDAVVQANHRHGGAPPPPLYSAENALTRNISKAYI